MDIFVVGGSGLLGSNIIHRFRRYGHNVIGTYRSNATETANLQLDKTDFEVVRTRLAEHDPDSVIDTAAFHNVDDCETDRNHAWSVNAHGTRNVATAANEINAHYIYISTDYVFPGSPDKAPYSESDPIAPVNYYGMSKYAGELASRICNKWTILRGSVIYGLMSDNFLTWAISQLERSNEISIVTDQVSRPTYAPDLARACVAIVGKNLSGLYHASGPMSVSRYEFTRRLAKQLDFDTSLVSPTTTEELGQDAPRPEDSSLDASALYEEIEFEFRPPEEAFADLQNRRYGGNVRGNFEGHQ